MTASGNRSARTAYDKRAATRDVNERIRLISLAFVDETQTDFICECASDRCFAAVPMTGAEWQAATVEAGYFVVSPGHEGAGEQAVVTTDRYAVVRLGDAGHSGAAERPH